MRKKIETLASNEYGIKDEDIRVMNVSQFHNRAKVSRSYAFTFLVKYLSDIIFKNPLGPVSLFSFFEFIAKKFSLFNKIYDVIKTLQHEKKLILHSTHASRPFSRRNVVIISAITIYSTRS